MRISNDGLRLITQFEGCRLTAYQDVRGVWTIGYGHAIGVCQGMTITQAQADALLRQDLAVFEATVDHCCIGIPTQHQFDAMVSLAYNIGPTGFRKSDVLDRFNDGDIAGAAEAFLYYDHAGGQVVAGLVKRRTLERNWFLTPDQ